MLRHALPLILVLSGCNQLDPATTATTDYLNLLQPLLQENSLLAERVLFQAAGIYNEATKPSQVATAWTSEIVPLAEQLHHQASFVVAPEAWSQRHSGLVDIWGERATAYRNLGEAIRLGDAALWNDSRKKADAVKLAEEDWFNDLNRAVGPLGLVVDPYP